MMKVVQKPFLNKSIKYLSPFFLSGRLHRLHDLKAAYEKTMTCEPTTVTNWQVKGSDYADHLKQQFGFVPFIFLANGKEIQFWDRQNYPPRKVSGFYTREDLERLVHQRNFSQSLFQIEPDAKIAGRDYQVEAIRRVTEAVEKKHRKFLLVTYFQHPNSVKKRYFFELSMII